MSWRKLFLVAVIVSMFAGLTGGTSALACASCGSGGDDPLILYPNEWLKVYLGFSEGSNFKNIDFDGSTSSAGGPTIKQTLTAAMGYGFSPRSFVTLTVPYMRNALEDESRTSVGDPSVGGRYSLVLQSIDEPLVPQIQVIYGYKFGRSRSLRESRERTLIDVFGSGFSEEKVGLDLWFGITRLKPGVSQTFSRPVPRSFDGVDYEPGIISRTTVSLGYGWLDSWKTTIGINRETRRALRVDGEEQPDSKQLNHSVFFTSDCMVSPQDTVRASLSRLAAVFDNYSSSRSDTAAVAYMHSF